MPSNIKVKIRVLAFVALSGIVLITKVAAQEATPHVVPVTIFYDKGFTITTKPYAAYIRIAGLDTVQMVFSGIATDYYVTGTPFRQIAYDTTGKEGIYQQYYPSRKLAQQGIFLGGNPLGTWQFFYPNGQLQQTVEFLPTGDYKVQAFYDSTGQQLLKDGTGQWQTQVTVRNGIFEEDVALKGQWQQGAKVGPWVAMQDNGKQLYAEEFEAGHFTKALLYDQNGKKVIKTYTGSEPDKWPLFAQLTKTEQFSYDVIAFGNRKKALQYILRKEHLLPNAPASKAKVEKMPEYPGGQAAMLRFLSQNFLMPADAAQQGVDGTVMVSLVIGVKGEVEEVKIVRALYPSVDEEVKRVVRRMPRWRPGTQDGVPVRVQYTLPYKIIAR